MLVTKHAAELCTLLVNDFYGELPSRILVALLTKGRATVGQLAQYTSLSIRHLRNGLGVLFQQNLLYTRTDTDGGPTSYEANPIACYNLVRSGKILDTIEREFGASERDLVQTLLLLGHARIHDLTEAYSARGSQTNRQTNGSNGTSAGLIESEHHFQSVLCRLIQAGIVETVRPDSFRRPNDVYQEIKEEVTKTDPGEKTSKIKPEQWDEIADKYRAFREQSLSLKRQLDRSLGPSVKRRKLHNGQATNGSHDDSDMAQLNPNVMVRINHEKCSVELRNHRLAEYAADSFGRATGEVYRTLLGLLTTKMSRCRGEPLIGEPVPAPEAAVTTLDVFDHLDDSIVLTGGIGRSTRDRIDLTSAERIREKPVDPEAEDSDNSDNDGTAPATSVRPTGRIRVSADHDYEDDSDDKEAAGRGHSGRRGQTNGDSHTKVQFEEEASPRDSRLDQMRQHLLLLSESKQQFIRHCGTQGRGQWTVDFGPVIDRLRETELDSIIEHSFGRHGLRLTRILREKGKLDEKMLHSAALMKKPDVQGKMLAMQMAGLVDVQEVPKDSSRMANRTLFFWFFDGDRTRAQLLDDVYKAMLRCLQTLHVERHKERNILLFVERKDVQGKEEEVMTAEHYNKYNRHLEVQEKLLGQLMRLDDIVSVFRDF